MMFIPGEAKHEPVASTYTPVIQDSDGKSLLPIGNSFTNGGFSMAMLDYRGV